MVWHFIGVYTINKTLQWPFVDTKFLFSCWKISHSFAALTCEIFFEKIQTEILFLWSVTCNVLYYITLREVWEMVFNHVELSKLSEGVQGMSEISDTKNESSNKLQSKIKFTSQG